MKNGNLHKAKAVKNDEFYTQLSDIEKELVHYKEHFKGKVVYCNCDSNESNFVQYFLLNFNNLKLKKLIATGYNSNGNGTKLEYNGYRDDENIYNAEDICTELLTRDGDFRSAECIELLEEADIIVTNPPFSLFREYIAQLMEYDKKFIVIGSMNAITYKETFKLIKDNRLWLGYGSPKEFVQVDDTIKKFGNICWYTNIVHGKRNEKITLHKKYTPEEYPFYDNYDAINVDKIKHIPMDYEGVMGVPITFMSQYNPKQFEILGYTSGRDEFEVAPSKHYINPVQFNPNGTEANGSKINTRSILAWDIKPKGVYYGASNSDKYLTSIYARILIKNKEVVK
jgi:hypothetical protein